MDFTFLELPSTLFGWLGMCIGLTLAVFLGYLAYMRARDASGDRLIKILQGTVTEMEKKIGALEVWKVEKEKAYAELETQNKTLVSILQGRDQQTQDFYRQAGASMALASETNALVKTQTALLERMVQALERDHEPG